MWHQSFFEWLNIVIATAQKKGECVEVLMYESVETENTSALEHLCLVQSKGMPSERTPFPYQSKGPYRSKGVPWTFGAERYGLREKIKWKNTGNQAGRKRIQNLRKLQKCYSLLPWKL